MRRKSFNAEDAEGNGESAETDMDSLREPIFQNLRVLLVPPRPPR
jgi:hypothetical protein